MNAIKNLQNKTRLRLKPFFRWYDLWIGIYIDAPHKAVYICPLPTIGLKIWKEEYTVCPVCQQEMYKAAYDTGDGWALYWECVDTLCDSYYNIDTDSTYDIEWPFNDKWMSAKDLEHFGFKII